MFKLDSVPDSVIAEQLRLLDVETVVKNSDSYAQVPFKTALKRNTATVFAHRRTFAEMRATYVTDSSESDLKRAVVGLSVASAVMISELDGKSIKTITQFYRPMSDSDDLKRKIYTDFENDDIDGANERFLLRTLLDGAVSADVAPINGLRVATRLSLDDERLQRLEKSAKNAFALTMGKPRAEYEAVMKSFGATSLEDRANLFANSLPHAMIAFAFPASQDYVNHIVGLLPHNR